MHHIKPVYIVFLVIGLAFFVGYKAYPFVFLFGLALLSTLILIPDRLKMLKEDPHLVGEYNLFIEGAFLLGSQLLIILFAAMMGYFMAYGQGVPAL